MARKLFKVPFSDFSYTTGEIETAVQLLAGANTPTLIKGVSIGFHGTDPAQAQMKVHLARQNITHPSSTAITPQKVDASRPEAILATAKKGNGTETGITNTIIETIPVHPQGTREAFYPFSDEHIMAGGTYWGLLIEGSTSQTCSGTLHCEE